MKNKKIVLVTLVLLVVGFIAAIGAYQNSVDSKNNELASSNKGVPFVRDHSPSFGQNKNKVIITEFLDPECESCSAFHPIIKEVFSDYKVETKLVIRYLDNHANSKFAIRLLEAARIQNKFNEALNIMFKYQPKWADHYAPKPELLWTFLSEAGLDMVKLKSDFETNNIDKMLNFDRMDAATLGVRGTPTFFVNGKILRELSHKALQDLVESEIYK
ncbi:thioredoxin domain-containing protein [Arcobacteraceae bacterium]|nr:thioredoxin domain-containing protein [Arcobacteraceae bacterium]